MPLSRRFKIVALLGLAVATTGCFGGPYTVTRVVDGRRVVGPFVSQNAYSAYLQGATLEAEGKNREALVAYEQALRHDPESPDLWTRVGAVKCALGDNPHSAFARAVALDSEYEAAWAALAHCHLARGEDERALQALRTAVSVEPQRRENIIELARVLELVGKAEEARRWLDALAIAEPKSVEVHRARLELALRTGDRVRVEASARRFVELAPDVSRELSERVPSLSPLARIDDALLRHDLDEARRLALSARVANGTVALRAVRLGRLSEGRELAQMALAADPADSDARVAAAAVAELTRDDAALDEALSDLPAEAAPLSELGRNLIGEMVRRRLGESGAR